jgi:hypothetical protein
MDVSEKDFPVVNDPLRSSVANFTEPENFTGKSAVHEVHEVHEVQVHEVQGMHRMQGMHGAQGA